MCEESEIIMEAVGKTGASQNFIDPQLVFSNSRNALYRITRQGKFFLIKVGRDAYAETLLRREYELSKHLVHPHLVKIWSFEDDTPVGPGLVMEYVNGRTLTGYLQEHPSSKEVERVFGQLLSVVSYVHHSGLLHNDLKPDNILISYADNDVRLIDFGLSDDDTHGFERFLGMSAGYASPELRSRNGNIDCRSDVYSVGRIMKDMFGRRFCWISKKATDECPDRRYASIDAFATAWNKRNFPSYCLLVVLLVFLFSAPSTLYFREHNARIALERQIESKRECTDSLIRIISSKLEERYEMAADSILSSDNKSERVIYACNYLEYAWALMDSIHVRTNDVEVGARIDSFCNKLLLKHQNELNDLLEHE